MIKINFLLPALLLTQVVLAQTFTSTVLTTTAHVPVKNSKVSLNTTTTEMGLKGKNQARKPAVILPDVLTEVFPNPAKGMVQCSFTGAGKGSVIISLQNSMGQEMLDLVETDFDDQPVKVSADVSNYAPGVYFMTFKYTDAAGNWQLISKKLQVAN